VPYSDGFKSRMIQRMTGPRAPSASALSHEVRVPQPTLSAWLRKARRLARMGRHEEANATPPAPRSPKSWSAEEKYEVVIEAAKLKDADLGEFLRKRGLHGAQLEEWRRLVKSALSSGGKGGRPAKNSDKKRLRELEREIHRKDKALAEMAALITLKKKLAALWGDEDEQGDYDVSVGPRGSVNFFGFHGTRVHVVADAVTEVTIQN
jgi:transposase